MYLPQIYCVPFPLIRVTKMYSMSQQETMNPTNPEDHVKNILPDFHEELLAHAQEQHLEEHSSPSVSPNIEQFFEMLKAIGDPEKKLEESIAFMERAIAQSGVPHFKDFWEARRICLDLFKENINPSVRIALWAKYSELCRQARKLRELFNEQSAFACEQIEMAVAALEKEVEVLAEWLKKMEPIEFGVQSIVIEANLEQYNKLQQELNLLNAYAARTTALRKELIKTEMRIRQKNKFFERLSALGDKIFPRRKELIHTVSSLFMNDVDRFIQTTFVTELNTAQLFDVREEIKALQAIAKTLTLNTEAFSTTRKSLSECWDSIKNVVKERRKIFSEQKAAFKEHRDQFMQEIEALKAACSEESLIATVDTEQKLDDLVGRMRRTSLGKQEIRELREKVRELREMLSSKVHAQDQVKRQQVQKKQEEQSLRFDKIKADFEQLLAEGLEASLDTCLSRLEALTEEVTQIGLTRAHKQHIEKLERQVRNLIEDKKDKQLLELSADDRESLAQLRTVLKERKARKQEIKGQIESWRKASSGSGLDFTKAIQLNELIAAENERLEKIEASIEEIQEQIVRLQASR